MLSNIGIKVKNLSKCYHIYEEPHHRLLQMLTRGKKTYFKEFWALKNVSFEVARGETVGIVGRNGSGKSTLLQMICGTLNQTSGQIAVHGRIAALLELGSGFNHEFTGRENVYLYASVQRYLPQFKSESYVKKMRAGDLNNRDIQQIKQSGAYFLVSPSIADRYLLHDGKNFTPERLKELDIFKNYYRTQMSGTLVKKFDEGIGVTLELYQETP